LRRTVREGVGLVVREARVIRSLDEPFRRKLAYLLETVQVGRYYVLEFSREGTTAERRRDDSSNGSSTSMSR
jgi:ribosomal protein S6